MVLQQTGFSNCIHFPEPNPASGNELLSTLSVWFFSQSKEEENVLLTPHSHDQAQTDIV